VPFADIDGFRMHYQVDGPEEAPGLMLSNSLGTSLEMWWPQIGAWSRTRRVIRCDTRGHGRSETPEPPYTIEAMAEDALALLDVLHIERVDFCGLSMGGMIGMWIAIHRSERLNKLILASTAATIGSPAIWNDRMAAVSKDGMDAVAVQVRSRWFTPEFQGGHEEVVRTAEAMLRQTDARGYAYCCEALRDADLRDWLGGISASTLILSGERDPVIPPEDGEALAAGVAGSKHVRLPAAHLSNLEAAEEFTGAVLEFID
jgi:3-oxoadipate enol-lactonase